MSRGKHAVPSRVWKALDNLTRWSSQKLLSRKWWLAAGTVGVAIGLDVAGMPLSEATLTFLGIAVPAYLVVEGGIDFIARRASDRKEKE
ncbi:MAG: hypothetical protein ABFE08_18960 [Armatimonadia bacterium]